MSSGRDVVQVRCASASDADDGDVQLLVEVPPAKEGRSPEQAKRGSGDNSRELATRVVAPSFPGTGEAFCSDMGRLDGVDAGLHLEGAAAPPGIRSPVFLRRPECTPEHAVIASRRVSPG